MLNALHAGPKQRGTERKQFNFTDGTRGDVYRCVLPYEDILGRVKEVCTGESLERRRISRPNGEACEHGSKGPCDRAGRRRARHCLTLLPLLPAVFSASRASRYTF